MGLDITAYKNIKKLGSCELYEDYEDQFDEDKTLYITHNNKDFPRMMNGIETNDVYSYEDTYNFRAGTYSGYNRWREWLSKMMIRVSPKRVWDYPLRLKDKPFYPLINFTDCDGIIDPDMCKKLHKDFTDNYEKIVEDSYSRFNVDLYINWFKAFEFASQNGCLVFG